MEAMLLAVEHDFNPRSPHGERPIVPFFISPLLKFQSTLPARGATRRKRYPTQEQEFQSTLPARGATKKRNDLVARGLIFQSTLPARGATRGES